MGGVLIFNSTLLLNLVVLLTIIYIIQLTCFIIYCTEVDYVSPLCSQVTYEGLLDDSFGICCGKRNNI